MIQHSYLGKFIVIEGLDGSGKNTQIYLLVDFFKKQGKKVLETKEPTTISKAGQKIAEALIGKVALAPAEFQKLFWQDRKEHLEKLVVPALKNGQWVVCSRYLFSSLAYGASEGLDLSYLVEMNKECLLPDLTIIIQTTPERCMEQIEQRGEIKKYFEKLEKLRKVDESYYMFPSMFKNVVTVDGEKTMPEVFEEVKKAVEKIL